MSSKLTNKYNEIISGWKNLLTNFNPDFIKEAERKASICAKCEKNIFNICIMCGCPLAAKTSSEQSICNLNKWQYDNLK